MLLATAGSAASGARASIQTEATSRSLEKWMQSQKMRAPMHERRECVSAPVVRTERFRTTFLLMDQIFTTFEAISLHPEWRRNSNAMFDPPVHRSKRRLQPEVGKIDA